MIKVKDIERDSHPLATSQDLDPIIESVGDARYVLLGEASHGTHEYYTWRTAISRRLIEEKGFSFIAVEGDWPDCYKINRFVKGHGEAGSQKVLKSFRRWPTWMWANWEVAALVEWMRQHNATLSAGNKVGFYGLDVYSLSESMELIVSYLEKADPHAAKIAREAYRCFEPYGRGQNYAQALSRLSATCREEALNVLQEVRQRSHHYDHDLEAALNTEMNAQVVANAERYYRAMVSFGDQSWNVRDTHMVQTLDSLMRFHREKAKAIVWEHNTHIGDARFTEMRDDGLINVGQLVREKYEKDGVFIVGFASYEGTVIAARIWGGQMENMRVPPAIKGSVEEILHRGSTANRVILLCDDKLNPQFDSYLGHRAIGVVYRPEAERGNYVSTLLPSRYDAVIYLDQSAAVHPLHLKPDGGRMPDTYPFGY
jgi:erythromycin esterase